MCVGVAYDVAVVFFVFFFKQKTAYEMRISDWSSDVCSSDLIERLWIQIQARGVFLRAVDDDLGDAVDLRQTVGDARFGKVVEQIGRASCRERVCQYV